MPRKGGPKFAPRLYITGLERFQSLHHPVIFPDRKSFSPYFLIQKSCSGGYKAPYIIWSLEMKFIVVTMRACLLGARCSGVTVFYFFPLLLLLKSGEVQVNTSAESKFIEANGRCDVAAGATDGIKQLASSRQYECL